MVWARASDFSRFYILTILKEEPEHGYDILKIPKPSRKKNQLRISIPLPSTTRRKENNHRQIRDARRQREETLHFNTRGSSVLQQIIQERARETKILSAMRTLRERHISQMLVLDGAEMIGVISERDRIKAVTYASLASFSLLMKERK